jgi:hypothetical protein
MASPHFLPRAKDGPVLAILKSRVSNGNLYTIPVLLNFTKFLSHVFSFLASVGRNTNEPFRFFLKEKLQLLEAICK